ncbi:M14 family metallopeptidase [bacterium]|nr:M14 family metallopeptidase [bacterium]
MKLRSRLTRVILMFGVLVLFVSHLLGQIPHPKDIYGFTPGDDYKLATYDQMLEYYKRLDEASNRVQMREIGKSVLGRPLLLLFLSTEENLQQLERWRSVSEQLARARIDEETARRLAKEGKSITWIDGGLHATEVAHAQMTSLLAYKIVTEETPEMQKIRENTIVLLMPVMNPDGLDIVAAWYKRNLGTPFETTRPPWLYHHYVGHDNNRDWFMNNMPESRAVTKILYNEWYPQIVYNHHQTGPRWTRIFIPPFTDPVNPNIHPGVTTGVNLVGSAMAHRFATNKMPGVVSDVIYSMWWNGGMRTVPYFHNMIGILTETSHATPSPRFFDPEKMPKRVGGRRGAGMPTTGTDIFYPNPWKGGMSHFRDPIRYMITGSMAVLRIASDMKEQWLYNIYSMGRASIEKGEANDPFAYVIPSEQWNAGEEINLVNVLQIGGVEVHKATKSFKVGDKKYPAGSHVVYGAQAFRPYAVDLLEKQTYPDRRRTPNGPPEAPYDLAGWTLPMQMGLEVDRVEEPFQANTEPITTQISQPAGEVQGSGRFGYLLSHRPNASVLAVNKLLKAGEKVHWTGEPVRIKKMDYDAGTILIKSGENTAQQVADLASELGLDFIGVDKDPSVTTYPLKAPRLGLYKSWQGNMDEGWTRWLLKEYAFVADTLHDADIQSADLSKYDAIILPHQNKDRILRGHAAGTMPQEFVGGLGAEGAVALKRYVEQGGTLVALDAASDFVIDQLDLPVRNTVANLSQQQFFIPGSLVRMDVENGHPLAYGMPEQAAASFVRSRAFEVVRLSRMGEGGKEEIAEAPPAPVEIVARYAKEDILMSGWALGEKKNLGGKAAMVRVDSEQGTVVLFGFRPQFRGQPRGTYKLFFNALHASTLDEMPQGDMRLTAVEPTEGM